MEITGLKTLHGVDASISSSSLPPPPRGYCCRVLKQSHTDGVLGLGPDRMRTNCCKALVAVSALLLSAGIVGAAEATLISVGGVKVALDKIVADYTKATSNQVKYTVGSPLIVSKKLADGEAFDVVVQSVPAMDDYAKLGGVKADTRVKVARGGIGMAMRKEATPLDISTADAFKKTLMQATSIAMTDTAMPNGSGILTHSIFTNAGLMDAIKPKIRVVGLDPGQEQIAKGEIEIGFFNISEIRPFVKFAGSAEHWKSAGMEPAH